MANEAVANSMPFLWEGTDRNGKKIKGKSLAKDETQVRADLRRQGVVPTRIKKQSKGLFAGGGKITTGDIAIFSRQLATMLAAGIPLVISTDAHSPEEVGRDHARGIELAKATGYRETVLFEKRKRRDEKL